MFLLGETINIGVGPEVARGTAVAPVRWIPGRTPTGVRPLTEKVLIRETKYTRFNSQGSEITQLRAEGDLEMNVRNGSIAYLFASLLGDVETAPADGESEVYVHTIGVLANNPQHPSLTLALAQGAHQHYRYPLAVVTQVEIRTPVDDLVNATASFVAQKEDEPGAPYTPSFESDDHIFRGHDVTVKIADDVAGLGAAQAMKLKEFSVSISNNGRPNQNIGSVNPDDVFALVFEVAGSMRIDREGETYHDIYVANTSKAMQIEMVRDDITLGSGESPRITITLPKVTFENLTPDRPIDDIASDSIEFMAHYDDDEAYGIEVEVVNEIEDITGSGS